MHVMFRLKVDVGASLVDRWRRKFSGPYKHHYKHRDMRKGLFLGGGEIV